MDGFAEADVTMEAPGWAGAGGGCGRAPGGCPPGEGPGAMALRRALLESRQRWRQFGALATDLVFETDGSGHLTFVAPDDVLGWRADALLGQPARVLLCDDTGPDPFQFTKPAYHRPTWMRTAAGETACMSVSVVPMLDEAGRQRGVRGTGVDVTAQQRASAATAAALRRSEVLDHILSRMRQEVLAPRMMRAVLDSLVRALGCRGAAVIDLQQPGLAMTLHDAGVPPPDLGPVLPALCQDGESIRTLTLPDRTPVLACPCSTRFGERAALLLWRDEDGRQWDADDLTLASSVTGVIRIVLEHEAIQRELARQARTDPLTGLLNRRAFLEEATRRLDRLEREGQPATLLFIDLDHLKGLNDRHGHEVGDEALKLVAALLHRTFRPTDLIARLGGDELAVWLDGADSLTAAERAEHLRLTVPGELAHLTEGEAQGVTLSTGIATRAPGSGEELEQVMARADHAMYAVKRGGRGHWRVSLPDGVG